MIQLLRRSGRSQEAERLGRLGRLGLSAEGGIELESVPNLLLRPRL
ncbi:hypothetical protein ACQEU6_31595 [Spirillospora sp. CA-108201]